jgi:type II secretory pathway component PulF
LALISLYPLAICCAAVAAIALRDRVLPRWAGILAAITALALAINAGFIYASFVPAFLLFLLWTLVTGVVLLRRTWSRSTQVAYAT